MHLGRAGIRETYIDTAVDEGCDECAGAIHGCPPFSTVVFKLVCSVSDGEKEADAAIV
jgi:hypothetical protein